MLTDDPDHLDFCDLAAQVDDPLPDDWVMWEVLFASVRYDTNEAIEARAREWRALFGGGGHGS
jgi:hypothetical protein